jgi:hypothetical protein
MSSLDVALESIKQQLNTLGSAIADAGSVAGYSQTETDNLLATYAPQASTYTKSEVDAQTYTRSQIDALVAERALASTVSALSATVSSHATRLDALEISIDALEAFQTDRFVLPPATTPASLINYPFGSSDAEREFKLLGYTSGIVTSTWTETFLGRIEEYPIPVGARSIHVRNNFHVYTLDSTGSLRAKLMFAFKLKTASSYTTWHTVESSIINKRQFDNAFRGIVSLEWVFELDALPDSISVADGRVRMFDSYGQFNGDAYDMGFKFTIRAHSANTEFRVNYVGEGVGSDTDRPPVISITSFA